MSTAIRPLVIPGSYVKARGLASKAPKLPFTFSDRVSVVYLLPDERFALFIYQRGYERTTAAGQWRRRGERLVLQGVADHPSDCTTGNFDKQSFTRHFVVAYHAAGAMLVDENPPVWDLLGWAGPFTFLGTRQCVTCTEWELLLYLGGPEQWDDISPWITAFLSRTTITPL